MKKIILLILLQSSLYGQFKLKYTSISLELSEQRLSIEKLSENKAAAFDISLKAISPDTLYFQSVFDYEGVFNPVYRPVEWFPETNSEKPRINLNDALESEVEMLKVLRHIATEGELDSSHIPAILKLYQRKNPPSIFDLYSLEEERPTIFNPYFINEKYLLCFELEMQNTDKEYREIQNLFTISDGEYQLHNSLSSDEIMQFHRDFPKIDFLKDDLIAYQQILDYYHFPESIHLGPQQKMKKIISFHPAILEAKELNIQHPKLDYQAKFKIDFLETQVDVEAEFVSISYLFKYLSYYFKDSELVIYSPDVPIYRDKGEILVSTNKLDQKTELYIIAESFDHYYFLKLEDLVFSDLIDEEKKEVEQIRESLKKIK